MKRRTLVGSLLFAAAPSLTFARGPTVAVFGDSLSDGLWQGLTQVCRGSPATFMRLGKVSSGLVKTDFYDWPTEAERIAAAGHACAIVFLGANDQQTIDAQGKRFVFGTTAWQDAYASRVARIAEAFGRRSIPLLWVGLPTAREPGISEGMRTISEIFREEVIAAGGLFVETRGSTEGPDRKFSTYLPDARGRFNSNKERD